MKNIKLLGFCILCGALLLTGCEKTNDNENLSCTNTDTCSIENINNENSTIEIEESPSIIVEEEGNGEGIIEEELENNEEISDQPMMRKMVVDENATQEEIENDMIETCRNLGGNRIDGMCILEDGSIIAF